MGALIKFALFILWGGLVPVLCGLLPVSFVPRQSRRLHLVIVAGYLSSFSICEVVGLPILFLTPTGNFRLLLVLYLVVSAVWIAAGLFRCGRTGGLREPVVLSSLRDTLRGSRSDRWQNRKPGAAAGERAGEQTGTETSEAAPPLSRNKEAAAEADAGHRKSRALAGEAQVSGEEIAFWLIYLALLGFQLVMAYRLASYDGDDAYYVAQSVQTWQTGTMYHYIPYTGVTTALDGRHAMAMMPMWITILARLCHTHPTIVTHSMVPMIFIPLADVCFYSLMCAMLFDKVSRKRNRRMLPAFMILLAVLQIFGNVSIYTPESFLLLRTWQGKTVFAVVIVPCIYTVLLHLAHRLNRKEPVQGAVFGALLVNMASGLCTSLAPFLTMGLFLLGGFFVALACRNRKGFTLLLPTCIPNLIYAGILLRIMLPVLLS